MKHLFKRILALALIASMLVGFTPTTAMAQETNNTMQGDIVTGVDAAEVSDDYISIQVSTKNGGFLISTVEGNKLEKSDDNKDLLYPSADYDTSYTSIRVTRTDGSVEDYIFGRKYGFLGLSSSDVEVRKSGNSILATWSVKDITVTQKLGLLDEAASQHGMVSIDYAVTTTREDVANVKIRIMLDTALGDQDYAYYQVPNSLNQYTSISNELLLDNTGVDAYKGTFFAIDDPKSPKVNAYTVDVAVGGEIVKPYQVAYAHWNSLASTVFDFTPDASINFTNQYNEQYMTADSAYALYYDLGALEKGTIANISTYYGVYSNSTVSPDESVAINFTSLPASMTFNADESAYISQLENGAEGDMRIQLNIENLTDQTFNNVTLVIKTMNNVTPYSDWLFNVLYETDSNYQEVRTEFLSGEELVFDVYYNVTPLAASEYRRFEILCYNAGEGEELTEAKLLGSREFYLFCPGKLGEVVVFNNISPQVIHYDGTRRLYLSGQNIGLMQDTTAYTTILRPVAGGKDVVVPSKNVVVDTTNNSMYLIIDTEMVPGGYQVIFDWYEAGKEDTTATALQFQVSDKPQYVAPTYGIVTIEKGENFTKQNPTYRIGSYANEMEYKTKVRDPNNTVFLEFRGDFGARYDEDGNLVEMKAASLTDIYGNIINTINISNCVDVEDGFVSINVENYGTDSQCINVDIEGKLYTTSSRTSIWDGVCAITSFENGNLYHLNQYKQDGSEATDVENSSANTDAIMLLWPGAASAAQTLAGVVFEFRYCQFGMIATQPGSVTSSTPKERVISFGAQMSPSFLLPKNFDWGTRETSAMEAVQLKLAKSNYTADQLRDVETRYKNDQQAWREAERGSLNIYVDNILFGSRGYIGFNATIEVGIPSYTDGMPSVGGTLELKILPAMDYWEVGLEGSADFVALKIEAAITLKQAYGGVPGVDRYYFYLEGCTPGINVDAHGIFWIQGLGGGIDNVYDTIYCKSKVPPISIAFSGKFALFALLEARADLSISPRGFSATLSELGIKGITLIDEMGLTITWYPELYFNAHININILDIIEGGGYIVVEKNNETDSYFWEGYAWANIHTPDLPIIGSIDIGGASLGLNADKMWGALRVIGVDMGLTYYWGGDVDFGFGKYDAPESTYPLALAVAEAGINEATGEPIYVCMGTNARMLDGSNRSYGLSSGVSYGTASGTPGITSSIDRMTHMIELEDCYNAARDIIVTLRYTADSEAEAKEIAQGDINGNNGIQLVAADASTYELKWLDNTMPADDSANVDANAIFSYNEETKEANVTISFTEEAVYEDWELTLSKDAEITLYEMRNMAGVDGINYIENDGTIDLSWSGYQLEDIETLSVYAVDEAGEQHLVYETDDYSVIAGGMANATSGSVTFDLPATLPTGEYKLQVVATSETNNICDIVEGTGSITHVNPSQPGEADIESIALGGDYSLNTVVNAGALTEGYLVTIYEQQTTNGTTEWVVSSLGAQWMEADEEGNLPVTITVGGQYETIAYKDADGNVLSASEAEGRDDVTEETAVVGLEAGKTYRIGIISYNQDENGNELFSKEVFSDAVVMQAPVKPNVTVAITDAETLVDSTGASENIDYVTTNVPEVQISSDIAVSGKWSLDAGAQIGTFRIEDGVSSTTLVLGEETALTDGEHTLTLTGTNAAGDSFAVDYRFYVKTTAPRLQISSPYTGSFFGETVTVTGLSDPGAKIYVLLDGVAYDNVLVGDDSQFEVNVAMDMSKYTQMISVYAENELGIRSYQYDIKLVNKIVSGADVELAIYVDGTNYTQRIIPAGISGDVELRVVSGGKSLVVPENSLLGNQGEWSLQVVEGSASLTDGVLSTDEDVNGLLMVNFEGYDISAVLGGNHNTGIQREIYLPTTTTGYEITPLSSTTVVYGGSFLFTIDIADGYTATDSFVVKANGTVLEPNENKVYAITNIFDNITITVDGIADVTVPGAEISIGEQKWNSFVENIDFDSIYEKAQSVALSATDLGSGVKGIYYLIASTKMTQRELASIGNDKWIEYSAPFALTGAKNIVYVKVVDKAGNVGFISSNGICIENACSHDGETGIRDAKDATETEDGYTGDVYCKDCGEKLESGVVIPATGPKEPVVPPETGDTTGGVAWLLLLFVGVMMLYLGVGQRKRVK